METHDALQEFTTFLALRGGAVRTVTPTVGIDAMLDFYRDIRCVDVDLDQDGDMLLFQWGTYDWGAGSKFEFSITRQLVALPGEDEDIWQLSLTFRHMPSAALEALGSGDHWCSTPAQLSDFRTYIRTHPAYVAVSSMTDGVVDLAYEQAG